MANCRVCGEKVKRSGRQFCSISCMNTALKTKAKIQKICLVCQTIFYVNEARKETKYCTHSCAYKGMTESRRNTMLEKPYIPLTRGKCALVDDADYDELMKYNWSASMRLKDKRWRAQREGIQMHRQIMGITDPKIIIDHINGDTLDNRRMNLRICTTAENARNRSNPRKGSRSGFVGVSWSGGKWHAVIMVYGKQISILYHRDKKIAAIARDKAALWLHGAFASINFPELFYHSAF